MVIFCLGVAGVMADYPTTLIQGKQIIMMRTVLVVLTLLLAACSPQSEAPVASAAAPTPAVTAPPPATVPAVPVAAAEPAPAPKPATLVLRGDGIDLGGVIAFGTPSDELIRKLTAFFSQPPGNVASLSDCGEGALEMAGWDNGFTTYSQEGKFTGWASVDQRTAEGIGFGSTRAELDAAYQPEVTESSLGWEFYVDGLSGILESDAPDAAISAFWSGMSCAMR
jgi:hypothetical protein